eukprot:gene56623-biopygen83272
MLLANVDGRPVRTPQEVVAAASGDDCERTGRQLGHGDREGKEEPLDQTQSLLPPPAAASLLSPEQGVISTDTAHVSKQVATECSQNPEALSFSMSENLGKPVMSVIDLPLTPVLQEIGLMGSLDALRAKGISDVTGVCSEGIEGLVALGLDKRQAYQLASACMSAMTCGGLVGTTTRISYNGKILGGTKKQDYEEKLRFAKADAEAC